MESNDSGRNEFQRGELKFVIALE